VTHRPRLRRGDEAGSISAFFAVALGGLVLVIGFVIDGGTYLRAHQQADAVAAEAARQAGQQIDAPTSIRGAAPRADVPRARAAALDHLATAGYAGTVTVTGGTRVTVSATTTRPTVFLALLGRPTVSVTGEAEVRLVRGLSTPT
jgi:Flp pilus assembly protein TadG